MFHKIVKILERNLKRSFNEKLDITKEEIQEYEKNGAILIDVRSPQEFAEGHLNGAICIPEYEIKNKNIENILKDKNKLIVVYCNSGQRSKKAQDKLIKLGYSNVYNIYDGIE